MCRYIRWQGYVIIGERRRNGHMHALAVVDWPHAGQRIYIDHQPSSSIPASEPTKVSKSQLPPKALRIESFQAREDSVSSADSVDDASEYDCFLNPVLDKCLQF